MISAASTTSSVAGYTIQTQASLKQSIKSQKLQSTVDVWRSQMERLFLLRTDQIVRRQCSEIDDVVEYAIERLPPATRNMRLVDFLKASTNESLAIFPRDYVAVPSGSRGGGNKLSFSCQTSPPKGGTKREHQTQTPVYTAVKRSRAEMENVDLASKIRSQLAHEAQHVILPTTSEYVDMPPAKKHQIVNILNAIVSTYEDIVENTPDMDQTVVVGSQRDSSFSSLR